MEHHDFTVLFAPTSTDVFSARVVDSLAGEVVGTFRIPTCFADGSSFSAFWGGGSAARGLSRSASASLTPEIAGKELYDALFLGPVGELFHECRGRLAEKQGAGLRLKLRLNPLESGLGSIYVLPWEYLYSSREREFLALSAKLSIVRYLDVPRAAVSMPQPEPLRILVAVSKPEGLAPLNLERELRVIEESVKEAGTGLEVHILESATPEALKLALDERPFHVFHFSGHGFRPQGSNSATLAFESQSGEPQFLDAGTLGQLLTTSPSIRLVFLNACNSSTATEADIFSSIAASLVMKGVPSVLANQFPISDRAAITFSSEFYSRLANGESLDTAVATGRMGVHATTPESFEWGVIALFSRLPENRIFVHESDGASSGPIGVRDAALAAVRSVASDLDDRPEPRLRAEDATVGNSDESRGVPVPTIKTDAATIPVDEAFGPIRESTGFLLRELEAAHKQARVKADSWSRASLLAAFTGLVLVVISVVTLMTGDVDTGKITAALSAITGAITALFFSQSRAANRRLDASFRELTLARDINLASEIVESMSDQGERDKLKRTLVTRVLENADRSRWYQNAAEPSAPAD